MDGKLALNLIVEIVTDSKTGDNFFRKHQIRQARKILKRKRILMRYIKVGRTIPKNQQFFNAISKYPDDVFKSHFRMNKSTFSELKNLLSPLWKSSHTGRPMLSLEKSLYITLWKLANRSSFREISDLFNIGRGTAYEVFIKVTRLISSTRSQIINWPNSIAAQVSVMEGFQNLRQNPFPFVVGCLDCTHIPILAPKHDCSSYYNRKGIYSLILQAVCDSKCRFIDVYFGYPGRCHDASVWKSSPLGTALHNRKIRLPSDAHILADSAYPLTTYIMVPYRDNGFLTPSERTFNYYHSSTRVVIEQAFGRLKNKFRILKYVDVKNIECIKFIVMSCVVLHNFIIDHEGNDGNEILLENPQRYDDDSDIPTEEQNLTSEEAKRKRENITNLFAA